jgi:RND superfamily putative drug exporter
VIVDVFPLSDSRSTVNRAAKAADQLAPSAGVGGVTAQYDDFISAAYGSFPVMLAIIAVLTVLLLARAFRSLLLTVKAVLLKRLSISVVLGGGSVLVWQEGYGSHALLGGAIPDRTTLVTRLMNQLRLPVTSEAAQSSYV